MLRIVATCLAVLTAAGPAAAEVRLLMVEAPGCMWCLRWHQEVGDAYPKTTEGLTAPLLRTMKGGPLPEGVTLDQPVAFTPTFVLVDDGAEVGRIEGYPGEDFFWPMLAALIGKLDATAGGPEGGS